MPDTTSNNKRIAKNTILLYFRQILIMIVSLYTVRIVLNVLGVEDYGIYNVTAGVVTLFSFLSTAMATASQRYFAFDLGKQDYEHLKITFSVTFQIYLLLAVVVIIVAETVGLWFVMNRLVIPQERLSSAILIYQASVVSFLLTLITTPYMACIIAHEKMDIYAYVSIVEAFLKLTIVFLLQVSCFDKLISYGFLLMMVSFINSTIYRNYCKNHYGECKFQNVKDMKLFKELVNYSGWNLFGALSGVLKKQGINIILNLFFGVFVNTAYSIALQVSSAVSTFSQNFAVALRPPIIKSYASGEYEHAKQLVFSGCKFMFFLLFLFSLPIIIEMDMVLKLWLKDISQITITMTRLMLVETTILSISFPIMTLAQATGNIKYYQIVVGGILLLNLPISYLFLRIGFPSYSVVIVAVLLEVLAAIARVMVVGRITFFNVKEFLLKVVAPCISVVLIASILPIYMHLNQPETSFRLITTTITSIAVTGIVIVIIGLNKQEKKMFYDKIISIINKIRN